MTTAVTETSDRVSECLFSVLGLPVMSYCRCIIKSFLFIKSLFCLFVGFCSIDNITAATTISPLGQRGANRFPGPHLSSSCPWLGGVIKDGVLQELFVVYDLVVKILSSN